MPLACSASLVLWVAGAYFSVSRRSGTAPVFRRHHVSNLSGLSTHSQAARCKTPQTIEMRLLPAGAPRLGLGLAALGRPGYITLNRGADLADRSVEAMRARAEEVLDAAYAGGVRWFDCARSYGLSEDFVGKWLEKRGHGSDAVAVSSKWGYRYTAGWRRPIRAGEPHEVKDHSAAHLRQQWPESDDLVGSHLRLYQVHSATFDSGILDNVETRSARGAQARQGLGARAVGVVAGPGDVVDAALKIEVDGERLFDAVQATYNIFEQAPGPSLTAAHAQGCTIIVKEAMANGRVYPTLHF